MDLRSNGELQSCLKILDRVKEANTLEQHGTELITAVEGFIIKAQGKVHSL